MKILFGISLLGLLLSSCVNRQAKNEQNILGDWIRKEQQYGYKNSTAPPPREMDIEGFSFSKNHIYDNATGFFKSVTSEKVTATTAEQYLGTTSKFKITSDSLSLFDLAYKRWHSYKIVNLDTNTLRLESHGVSSNFIRVHPEIGKTPQFDQIIISTSGCMGLCPISNTMIASDGLVVFEGIYYTLSKGLFIDTISNEAYLKLQDNFRKADFAKLKTAYTDGPTDMETITTTFVKNGKIYKSVSDYGDRAPYLFRSGYAPLEYLYQTIPLKKLNFPESMQRFGLVTGMKLINGHTTLEFKQSETFLLIN